MGPVTRLCSRKKRSKVDERPACEIMNDSTASINVDEVTTNVIISEASAGIGACEATSASMSTTMTSINIGATATTDGAKEMKKATTSYAEGGTSEEKVTQSFQCQECHWNFNSASSLQKHIKTHLTPKPFKCTLCPKQFASKFGLDNHLRRHTGERPYECDTCNKTFASRNVLVMHMRGHTGEQPYQCLVCGARFTQSASLADHRRIHTGERPFTCEICHKKFKNKGSYRVHLAAHKDKDAKGEGTTKECNFCHKNFPAKKLQHHIRYHHIKPWKCAECVETFGTKNLLERHIYSKHFTEEPHVCEICGKKFITTQCFNNHVARHGSNRAKRCSHCGLWIKSQMSRHRKRFCWKLKPKTFVSHLCKHCGKQTSKSGYRPHYDNCPQDGVIPSFFCDFCKKECGTMEEHVAHLLSHVDRQNPVYECIEERVKKHISLGRNPAIVVRNIWHDRDPCKKLSEKDQHNNQSQRQIAKNVHGKRQHERVEQQQQDSSEAISWNTETSNRTNSGRRDSEVNNVTNELSLIPISNRMANEHSPAHTSISEIREPSSSSTSAEDNLVPTLNSPVHTSISESREPSSSSASDEDNLIPTLNTMTSDLNSAFTSTSVKTGLIPCPNVLTSVNMEKSFVPTTTIVTNPSSSVPSTTSTTSTFTFNDSYSSGYAKRPSVSPTKKLTARKLKSPLKYQRKTNFKSCVECGENFNTQGLLKFHFYSKHTKTRLKECEICSKKFTETQNFNRHVARHDSNRAKRCSRCGLWIKSQMSRHRKRFCWKLKPKTFVSHLCKHCGKQTSKSGYRPHYDNCPQDGVIPSFFCDFCKKECGTMEEHVAHLLSHVDRQNPVYECIEERVKKYISLGRNPAIVVRNIWHDRDPCKKLSEKDQHNNQSQRQIAKNVHGKRQHERVEQQQQDSSEAISWNTETSDRTNSGRRDGEVNNVTNELSLIPISNRMANEHSPAHTSISEIREPSSSSTSAEDNLVPTLNSPVHTSISESREPSSSSASDEDNLVPTEVGGGINGRELKMPNIHTNGNPSMNFGCHNWVASNHASSTAVGNPYLTYPHFIQKNIEHLERKAIRDAGHRHQDFSVKSEHDNENSWWSSKLSDQENGGLRLLLHKSPSCVSGQQRRTVERSNGKRTMQWGVMQRQYPLIDDNEEVEVKEEVKCEEGPGPDHRDFLSGEHHIQSLVDKSLLTHDSAINLKVEHQEPYL